ncbi:MAG: thiamine-phosphate kinase [Myxococcales bacterium]|nr:thiamine-phosphate kinase [Myxococcales bacterium]
MNAPHDREERLLGLLRTRLGQPHAHVLCGIGDDAAVLESPGAPIVCTVDAQVEGIHFRSGYLTSQELGRRAYMVSASDLAAMGASPYAALLALTLPDDVTEEAVLDMCDGAALGAKEVGAPVVGGNLSGGALLSLTMTLIGIQKGPYLRRDGAELGDQIYVTGTVGQAALGLACLERGDTREDTLPFVERWRAPSARIREGASLGQVASSAIDLSDGLFTDLNRLTSASCLGAVVYCERLPIHPAHHALCKRFGLDAFSMAIYGGEDYELVFTSKNHAAASQMGTCIGEITEAPDGVRYLKDDGKRVALSAPRYMGW